MRLVSPRLLPRALALLAVVLLVPAWAQGEPAGDEPVARVAAALEAGDAEAVLGQVDGRVELVLFDRGGLFSRGQAALVLDGFFRRHPPTRVVLAEQSLTDEERAAMGRYYSRTGEPPLRVYVRFRPEGAAWALDAVRIERGTSSLVGGLQ